MSFCCCRCILNNVYSFYIETGEFDSIKVEFKCCPYCGTAFYKEIRNDYKGNTTHTTIKRGSEAERLIQKAYFNRLVFLERISQGTKANNNWFYGDFKISKIKDIKGNPLQIQIKRNFNGEEVTNFGVAKVVYK